MTADEAKEGMEDRPIRRAHRTSVVSSSSAFVRWMIPFLALHCFFCTVPHFGGEQLHAPTFSINGRGVNEVNILASHFGTLYVGKIECILRRGGG